MKASSIGATAAECFHAEPVIDAETSWECLSRLTVDQMLRIERTTGESAAAVHELCRNTVAGIISRLDASVDREPTSGFSDRACIVVLTLGS